MLYFPFSEATPITLIAGQGHGANKLRRNRFYEQFGLQFDYADPEHRAGVSRPMSAGDLAPVPAEDLPTKFENLRERDLVDAFSDLLRDNERMTMKLRCREQAIADLSDWVRQAEVRPLRWALRQLCSSHTGTVVMWLLVMIFAGTVWVHLKL